jgi:tetratricopeptide (TPR) repeat protein
MSIAPTSTISVLARAFSAAMLLASIGLTAGCETTQETRPSNFTQDHNIDSEFAAGADRPPTPHTIFRLARLLAAQGKDQAAESALTNCLDRYPDFSPAYEELANLYVRHRKIEDAARVLQSGLHISPNDPVLRNDLGMCWLMLERYQLALEQFQIAAQASPDDARYAANVALALGSLGRYDEAIEHYRAIVPIGQGHYNVGVIARAHGDEERAKQEFEFAAYYGVYVASATESR